MKMQQNTLTAYGFSIHHKPLSFLGLLRPHKSRLILGVVLILITNLIMVSLPLFINAGVSFVEQGSLQRITLYFCSIKLSSIYSIVASIIGLAIFGALIRTLSRTVLFDVGRIIERDVRAELFFHISLLDDRFYKKSSVGDLMNHLSTDVGNVRMVVGFAVLNVVNIVFVFCFTVPLLLSIDVTTALVSLLPFPLIALAMVGITKKMFRATTLYQEQLSGLVSHIQENLLGAQVVRLFNQQQAEGQRFLLTNQRAYQAGLNLGRIRVLMMPIMRLLLGFSIGLVLFIGGQAVFFGRISLGDFVEINTRILQMSWPAMSIGFVMSIVSRGQASLERINRLLKETPLIADGQQTLSGVGDIKVTNLVLNQEHRDSPIDFDVKKGQVLALVGKSGSYKSTLLKVLSRRQHVAPGTVFFDGHDSNDVTLASFYQHVSVVEQQPFLFNATILDNLRFANPEISHAEIERVIKLIRFDHDLNNFAEGLNTMVGERGVTLSGGQKQRLALGRALLAQRDVLILDDALSAVDKDTERHIVSELKPYLFDKIVIIATHRLSLCRLAEQILVLEHGIVIESGNHKNLMTKNGLYASLVRIENLEASHG